jgi:hypothetical protein
MLDSLVRLITANAASADKKFTALTDDIAEMRGDVADIRESTATREQLPGDATDPLPRRSDQGREI